MLTYQLREHVVRVVKRNTLQFPNNIEAEFTFCPSGAFGMVTESSRTIFKGDKPKLVFSANTGRQYATPSVTPKMLEVSIGSNNYQANLESNKLYIRTRCGNQKDLRDLIETIYYGLTPLLNLDFHDAPFIEYTCGKVGNIPFSWEHKTAAGTLNITTNRIQKKRVLDAWKLIVLLGNHRSKRRLLAALQYFYTACRLSEAGSSPSEFMAEIILNYAKILEVLFPPCGDQETRDAAREGLKKLAYSENEIECDFIPAMLLRSKMDVGHVKLSLFNQEQLNILHKYVDEAESIFRSMFQRLFSAIESEPYPIVIADDPNSNLGSDTASIIKRLVECQDN